MQRRDWRPNLIGRLFFVAREKAGADQFEPQRLIARLGAELAFEGRVSPAAVYRMLNASPTAAA